MEQNQVDLPWSELISNWYAWSSFKDIVILVCFTCFKANYYIGTSSIVVVCPLTDLNNWESRLLSHTLYVSSSHKRNIRKIPQCIVMLHLHYKNYFLSGLLILLSYSAICYEINPKLYFICTPCSQGQQGIFLWPLIHRQCVNVFNHDLNKICVVEVRVIGIQIPSTKCRTHFIYSF